MLGDVPRPWLATTLSEPDLDDALEEAPDAARGQRSEVGGGPLPDRLGRLPARLLAPQLATEPSHLGDGVRRVDGVGDQFHGVLSLSRW